MVVGGVTQQPPPDGTSQSVFVGLILCVYIDGMNELPRVDWRWC